MCIINLIIVSVRKANQINSLSLSRSHSSMLMLPLFAILQWIAEPNPFLYPFFPTPQISSFWGTSTAITSSGTQKVLPTLTRRKYLIGSSLLTSSSSSSMNLTYLLFSIAPLTVTPLLTSPLLSHLLILRGASGPGF